MPEQATSRRSDPAARGEDQVAALQAELAGSREEILRLRDLLISKDAELGTLKGRVAQLEAGSAQLLNLYARLRNLLPEPVVRALRLLRRQS